MFYFLHLKPSWILSSRLFTVTQTFENCQSGGFTHFLGLGLELGSVNNRFKPNWWYKLTSLGNLFDRSFQIFLSLFLIWLKSINSFQRCCGDKGGATWSAHTDKLTCSTIRTEPSPFFSVPLLMSISVNITHTHAESLFTDCYCVCFFYTIWLRLNQIVFLYLFSSLSAIYLFCSLGKMCNVL